MWRSQGRRNGGTEWRQTSWNEQCRGHGCSNSVHVTSMSHRVGPWASIRFHQRKWGNETWVAQPRATPVDSMVLVVAVWFYVCISLIFVCIYQTVISDLKINLMTIIILFSSYSSLSIALPLLSLCHASNCFLFSTRRTSLDLLLLIFWRSSLIANPWFFVTETSNVVVDIN